jgi:hypothetical protein
MRMNVSLVVSSLACAALLAFGASAFAQHGNGGGGRPAGVGAGSMGEPGGVGGGNGARPSDAGFGSTASTASMGSMGHSNAGSQSPETVLSNPRLETSLTSALGKSGITIPGGNLQTACSGFKNLGQCLAAMHVAKNLNLNFADLRSKMTGSNAKSLGKTIQDLGGPNVSAKSETKKANKQAKRDINAAESAS